MRETMATHKKFFISAKGSTKLHSDGERKSLSSFSDFWTNDNRPGLVLSAYAYTEVPMVVSFYKLVVESHFSVTR